MLKVLYTVCSETLSFQDVCHEMICYQIVQLWEPVTHTDVEDQFTKPTLHARIIYSTDAQKFFLHVSALLGLHHQGVYTVVKIVLLKWVVLCRTVSHARVH